MPQAWPVDCSRILPHTTNLDMETDGSCINLVKNTHLQAVYDGLSSRVGFLFGYPIRELSRTFDTKDSGEKTEGFQTTIAM